MAEKHHHGSKKKKNNKHRRLQTDLNKTEAQELDAIITAMCARSESEAVRRMIRFVHTIAMMGNAECAVLMVEDAKVIVPF